MRNLISSSALRLCDWLFDNGDIQFAYIDKVLAFTFGAEQLRSSVSLVTLVRVLLPQTGHKTHSKHSPLIGIPAFRSRQFTFVQ